MKRFAFALLLHLLLTAACFGQLGIDNPFWKDCWSASSDAHKTVVRVACTYPGMMAGGGTGVSVEGGCFLTANHVVDGATSIRVVFSDGKSVQVQVKRFDSVVDFAILIPVEKLPDGLPFSKISKRELKLGEELEVCGLAGGQGLRHFYANVDGFDGKRIVFDGYVIQGDSGGPIFNAAGEVVAVVSGGVLWHEEKIANGNVILSVTTPIIGPDVRKLGIVK